MIGVAVVLILLVLVFGFAVVISNTGPARIDDSGFLELSIFGARISATVPGIFFTGAVTMIILLLALLLLIAGIRRARGQRKRIKSLTESAQGTDSAATGSGTNSTATAEIEAKPRDADADHTSGAGDEATSATAPADRGERAASTTRPAGDDDPASSTPVGSTPPPELPDDTPAAGRDPRVGNPPGSDAAGPETTPEERSRLLEEVERATGDDRPANN